MNYVFVNYDYSPNFSDPDAWIKRISMYGGILECLAKNHEVHLVAQIDYVGDCIHNGVVYHFVESNKPNTLFPWKVNRFVKNLKPDVVVIGGLHRPLQALQLKLLLNNSVKLIAHHHAERPFNGVKKIVQKLCDRYMDAYLFASHNFGMQWVNNGNLASPNKTKEVMEVSSTFSPMDKQVAQAKTGITGDLTFLWVGRLNANKDPLNTVRGFLKFWKLNPQAKLYMIYHTDDLLQEIKVLLAETDDTNPVTLVGELTHDDLLYWYNSVDFVLSGSHYEGGGTAICEAMSCGCIPVITDIFSFRMMTDNGRLGVLYEAGNELALIAALNQSLTLNRAAVRKDVLAYFENHLSFNAIARKIEEVVASL